MDPARQQLINMPLTAENQPQLLAYYAQKFPGLDPAKMEGCTLEEVSAALLRAANLKTTKSVVDNTLHVHTDYRIKHALGDDLTRLMGGKVIVRTYRDSRPGHDTTRGSSDCLIVTEYMLDAIDWLAQRVGDTPIDIGPAEKTSRLSDRLTREQTLLALLNIIDPQQTAFPDRLQVTFQKIINHAGEPTQQLAYRVSTLAGDDKMREYKLTYRFTFVPLRRVAGGRLDIWTVIEDMHHDTHQVRLLPAVVEILGKAIIDAHNGVPLPEGFQPLDTLVAHWCKPRPGVVDHNGKSVRKGRFTPAEIYPDKDGTLKQALCEGLGIDPASRPEGFVALLRMTCEAGGYRASHTGRRLIGELNVGEAVYRSVQEGERPLSEPWRSALVTNAILTVFAGSNGSQRGGLYRSYLLNEEIVRHIGKVFRAAQVVLPAPGQADVVAPTRALELER